MKLHSTNYTDTFIEVAEDTNATQGIVPPAKNKKTIAQMQYEMISQNPYKFTSDDVLFHIFAERNNLSEDERPQAREVFFSKGQPCFRTSPLTRMYGFGIHSNREGKIALYGMETSEYHFFLTDDKIRKIKAMKLNKK